MQKEGRNGPKDCRVQAAPFIGTQDGYDTQLYLELLARAVAEVMQALEEIVKECSL